MKYLIRIFPPPGQGKAKTDTHDESNFQRAKQLLKRSLMKKQYGCMGAVWRSADDHRLTAFYFRNHEGLKKL